MTRFIIQYGMGQMRQVYNPFLYSMTRVYCDTCIIDVVKNVTCQLGHIYNRLCTMWPIHNMRRVQPNLFSVTRVNVNTFKMIFHSMIPVKCGNVSCTAHFVQCDTCQSRHVWNRFSAVWHLWYWTPVESILYSIIRVHRDVCTIQSILHSVTEKNGIHVLSIVYSLRRVKQQKWKIDFVQSERCQMGDVVRRFCTVENVSNETCVK